jgi:hypothetical protein
MLRRVLLAIALVAVWSLLHPGDAHAWTPAPTSVSAKQSRNLRLLPPGIAALLSAFPFDYLYGRSRPTPPSRKYAPAGNIRISGT